MASAEAHRTVEKMVLHAVQVAEGLIPEDSPPTFTLPQPLDDKGLPWWFGPDYHPTPEAVAEFSKPMDEGPEPTAQGQMFD
jgi:hypothetical protein